MAPGAQQQARIGAGREEKQEGRKEGRKREGDRGGYSGGRKAAAITEGFAIVLSSSSSWFVPSLALLLGMGLIIHFFFTNKRPCPVPATTTNTHC